MSAMISTTIEELIAIIILNIMVAIIETIIGTIIIATRQCIIRSISLLFHKTLISMENEDHANHEVKKSVPIAIPVISAITAPAIIEPTKDKKNPKIKKIYAIVFNELP